MVKPEFDRLEDSANSDGEAPSADPMAQPEGRERAQSDSLPDSGISLTEKPGEEEIPAKLKEFVKMDSYIGFQLPTRYRITMLIFACLGNFVVIISRLYPAGFYLDFVVNKGLNTTYGTISISAMLITSAAIPFVYYCLPKSIKKSPMHIRCLVLCFINALCIGLMSLVDVALKSDPSGFSAFGTIFSLRSIQGIIVGLLYVLVQGEVVDLYFKDDEMAIILISCFLQIGAILSAIISAELYVHGGWLLLGLALATVNFLPLILLPPVRSVQKRIRRLSRRGICKGIEKKLLAVESMENGTVIEDGKKLGFQSPNTISRKFAFYMPDILVFMNNLVCDLIAYVLPARIVLYSSVPLSAAVPLFQIGNLCSLFLALLYSFLASKNKTFDVLNMMAVANVSYYLGSVIAFAATTTTFRVIPFFYQLIIGLVLMGLGEAGHLNLLILSKFSLYEKWKLPRSGLGKRSTMINNVSLSISSALGTAISGFSLTKNSEIITMTSLTGVCIFLTIGLILARVVK